MTDMLTEEQRTILKGAVQEMVESHYRGESEKELRRDIGNRIKDVLNIPKKTFNSLSLRAYKNDATKVNSEITEMLDLAEELGFYHHNED